MEEFKKILDYLKQDIPLIENDDIIGTLFDEKSNSIEERIIHTKVYQEYRKEILQIECKIYDMLIDNSELLNLVEQFTKITYDRAEICDKLMYKYGFYDGMTLVIEGLKKINMNEFLDKNKDDYLKVKYNEN